MATPDKNDTKFAYGLNKMLPDFANASGKSDATQIVQKCNQSVKLHRASPLKTVLDELFENETFDIPVDIIDIIKVYEFGSITYHYSKTFEKHIENTLYITPILLSYIETFIFLTLFIIPFIIPKTLTPLLIIIGTIYFIHGICIYLSYKKCSSYEIFIREFKQSLHNNDKFCQQITTRISIDIESISDSLSNPSNNTFAYIAFQRWLNVKELELKNDKFTRSREALCICLSKYFIPSILSFSIIVFDHDSGLFGSIWVFVLFHLFDFFGYCYFRVAEGSDPKKVLKWTIIYVIVQDIVCLIVGISISSASQKNEQETAFIVTDVVYPIIYGLLSLIFGFWFGSMIFFIIKYNEGFGERSFWFIACLTFIMFGVLFTMPSWSIIYIGIPFFYFMAISYYMAFQQLIQRIMTGLKTDIFVQQHISKDPQKWLINELKWLFVPNQKLWFKSKN